MDDSPRTTHTHQQTKAVRDQLARTAGHINSIKRMVEEERSCSDILVQLAAVRASIDRVSKLVLEDHIDTCLSGISSEDVSREEWQALKDALNKFIR